MFILAVVNANSVDDVDDNIDDNKSKQDQKYSGKNMIEK